MLFRTALVRISGNSHRSLCYIRINRAQRQKLTCGSCTFPQFRCYSEDITKTKSSYDVKDVGKEKKENEDALEMFDVDKERNKLSNRKDLSKYKVFKDEDSPIIFDVEEECLTAQSASSISPEISDEYDGISLERGVRGVFDVEELVEILRVQNASNLVVIELPKSLGYADQMVIVTGKSARHLLAIATHVRQLFKKKMHPDEKIPAIEGRVKKSEDWFALDLGNIILHIFSEKTRRVYDLESLWALGPEFDPLLNQPEDPLSAIISKHSLYLSNLQPADTSVKG